MNRFDITDYGAKGDGKTICTEAFQRAVCECSNGGTVYVPSGTFVIGAVFLKSGITIFLEKGAKLLGSPKVSDYPIRRYRFEGLEQDCFSSLINAENVENITFDGEGTIDACGAVLFNDEINSYCRGRAICINRGKNITIKNITVRNSPSWCVHLIYCKDVVIDNVKIHTKYDENGKNYGIFNGDGIDVDSCAEVEIKNSLIASQDDCIAIKSGKDAEGRKIGIPSENITIKNCEFKYGFGAAIGSEMSGGVRNVTVENCIFTDTFSIGSVKAPRGRGGFIENITYKDCSMVNRANEFHDCEWFRGALYVDQFYGHVEFDPNEYREICGDTPEIRNIRFENIRLETNGGNAIYIAGLAECPIKNVTVKNVTASGLCGIKAYNVKNLCLENTDLLPCN